MDGKESSMMQREQLRQSIAWVIFVRDGLICSANKERSSHRSVIERSFMQSWLDLCLSKDVGPGLDSCDSEGGSAYLAVLP